jgi:anti-sigma B factor antagonist
VETPNKLLVAFEQQGRVTVATIRAASVLDALNVTEFGRQVLDYIKDKPALHLLLNFRNVKYLSSAALTELLRINESIGDAKGTLRLMGLNAEIQEVFRITNLDKVFVIYEGELPFTLRKYERSLAIAAQEQAWTDPGKSS